MATMKLTTLQMERELNYKNESLFDDFAFPTDPDNLLDHATLKNRILMRCGEFEVLYSDPDVYKLAVEVWSNAYKRTFDKWLAAVFADYNPIENYNMRERFQDNGTMSGTESANDSKNATNSASGSGTFNGSITNNQESSANGTHTHNVSAFDSSNFSPESQDITEDSANSEATETNENTTTSSTEGEAHETGTHAGNKSEQTQNIHTGERSGNIGVTSSQQLLEAEFKVALFSIYDRIADLFVHEFCIMLY